MDRRLRAPRQRQDLGAQLREPGREAGPGEAEGADRGLDVVAAFPEETEEPRRVRPEVGDVLLQDDESRFERRLLGADRGARAPERCDPLGRLGRVVRLEDDRVEACEELPALPEGRRLRPDLPDPPKLHAARSRKDEPNGNLDLVGDDEARSPGREDSRESLERLEDRPGNSCRRRDHGLVHLSGREGAEEPVERRIGDRPAAAGGGPGRERAGLSLIARVWACHRCRRVVLPDGLAHRRLHALE